MFLIINKRPGVDFSVLVIVSLQLKEIKANIRIDDIVDCRYCRCITIEEEDNVIFTISVLVKSGIKHNSESL